MSIYKQINNDRYEIMPNIYGEETSGGNGTNIYGEEGGGDPDVGELDPNMAVKTDGVGVLQSSNLEISDTNGLQTALNNAITNPYVGTLQADDFKGDSYKDKTEASSINMSATEVDVVTGTFKINGAIIDSSVDLNDAYLNGVQPHIITDPTAGKQAVVFQEGTLDTNILFACADTLTNKNFNVRGNGQVECKGLDMTSTKITSVADGVAIDDCATVGQLTAPADLTDLEDKTQNINISTSAGTTNIDGEVNIASSSLGVSINGVAQSALQFSTTTTGNLLVVSDAGKSLSWNNQATGNVLQYTEAPDNLNINKNLITNADVQFETGALQMNGTTVQIQNSGSCQLQPTGPLSLKEFSTTGDIFMGGTAQIHGLANGTLPTDAVNLSQVPATGDFVSKTDVAEQNMIGRLTAPELEAITYKAPTHDGTIVYADDNAGSNWGNMACYSQVIPFQSKVNTVDGGNISVGDRALFSITTATSSTSAGIKSLEGLLTGEQNTAYGYQSLKNLTNGDLNVGVGSSCGNAMTSGDKNVFVGRQAMIGGTTHTESVAIGEQNGCDIINVDSSTSCVFLGANAYVKATAPRDFTNVMLLGANIDITDVADNTTVIGDSSMGKIIPNSDGVCDLGDQFNRWRDISCSAKINCNSVDATTSVSTDLYQTNTSPELILRSSGGAFLDRSNGVAPLLPINYSAFTQTNETSVNNTTVETDLISTVVSTGVGSLSIPANAFKVGTTVKISLGGHCDNASTSQDPRFRLYLGANLVSDLDIDMASVTANTPWKMETQFVVTAIGVTGSIKANAFFTYIDGATMKGDGADQTNVYNSTISNDMKLTVQWANADVDNQMFCDTFVATILYNPPS